MSSRVEVLVSGRVQGVMFRDSTRYEARRLGLTGWVQNLPDGRVRLQAQGEPDAVSRLIAWCRTGPPLAQVSGLELADLAPEPSESGFVIR